MDFGFILLIVGSLSLIVVISFFLYFKFCHKSNANKNKQKSQDEMPYRNSFDEVGQGSMMKMSNLIDIEYQDDDEFMKSVQMMEVTSPTDRSSSFINVDFISGSNCDDDEFMKRVQMVEVISPTDRSSSFINVDLIPGSNCDDDEFLKRVHMVEVISPTDRSSSFINVESNYWAPYEIPERSNSFVNPLFEETPLPKRLVEQSSFEIDETLPVYQANEFETNFSNQNVTVHAADVNLIDSGYTDSSYSRPNINANDADKSEKSIITLNEFDQFPNLNEISETNSKNSILPEFAFNASSHEETINEMHGGDIKRNTGDSKFENDPFVTSQYKTDDYEDTINIIQEGDMDKNAGSEKVDVTESQVLRQTSDLKNDPFDTNQYKINLYNNFESSIDDSLIYENDVTLTDASQESILIDENREKIIQNIDASYDKPVILSNDEDSIITSNEINQFLNSNERNSDSNQTSDDSKFKFDISHEVELSTDNHSLMNTEDVSVSDVSQETILNHGSLDQELLPAIESPIESTTAIDLNSSTEILANVDLMAGASDDSSNGDFCKLSSFGSQDTLEKVDSMENLDDSFMRVNLNETENSMIDLSSSDVTDTSSIITVRALSELNISNDIQSSEELLSDDNESDSFIIENTDHDKIENNDGVSFFEIASIVMDGIQDNNTSIDSFSEWEQEIGDDITDNVTLDNINLSHLLIPSMLENTNEEMTSNIITSDQKNAIESWGDFWDDIQVENDSFNAYQGMGIETQSNDIEVGSNKFQEVENEISLDDTSEILSDSETFETYLRKSTLQEDSLYVSSQTPDETKLRNDIELSNDNDSFIDSKDVNISDVSQESNTNQESIQRQESESEHTESFLVDVNIRSTIHISDASYEEPLNDISNGNSQIPMEKLEDSKDDTSSNENIRVFLETEKSAVDNLFEHLADKTEHSSSEG